MLCTSEAGMGGAFTVTRTSTNTCNSVVIKNLLKIVKYLVNIYSAIAGNVVGSRLCRNCDKSTFQMLKCIDVKVRLPKNIGSACASQYKCIVV